MIISQKQIFGFSLYKKTRLKHKKLDLEAINNPFCDDIGLYVVSQDPNFEYNYFSFSEKKDWFVLANETLRLVVFNLICNSIIDIFFVEGEKNYCSGLFKTNFNNHYIKIINSQCGDDELCKLFLKSIDTVNKRDNSDTDLNDYIHHFIDMFLSNNEYNNPAKKFIIEVIKHYAKTHNWIKLVSEKRYLGLYKQHKVELNKIYIPRLKIHHDMLKEKYKSTIVNHSELRNFFFDLRNTLENDFNDRRPKNDGG